MDFQALIRAATADQRLTTTDFSVYCALLSVWTDAKSENVVNISRSEIMHLAKIRSITTFHKCIKQLAQLNYVHYIPSFHPAKASKIIFVLRSFGNSK